MSLTRRVVCWPGVRPGGRVPFLARPRNGTKRRAPHCRFFMLRRYGSCGPRFFGGVGERPLHGPPPTLAILGSPLRACPEKAAVLGATDGDGNRKPNAGGYFHCEARIETDRYLLRRLHQKIPHPTQRPECWPPRPAWSILLKYRDKWLTRLNSKLKARGRLSVGYTEIVRV